MHNPTPSPARPAAPSDPLPEHVPSPARSRSGWRRLGLLGFALVAAVAVYLLRPGSVNDDTYAFLDWGRDLRHGYLPLLEHRTFHPGPIVAGSILSLFGSATPTIVVLLFLVGLVLAAAAVWRITALLGFGWPASVLATLLVLAMPLLPVLALVAYINLPFAALILWALVFALEERRRAAWLTLVVAGLVRPEGWAFLVAYGLLTWWRAGRPLAPRRWLGIAALALGPMMVWVALEWGLFGDPLYSLHNTTGSAVHNTHSSSASALWNVLRANLTLAPLIAAGIGAVAVAWLAPRRLAVTMLGATAVAALTIVILARSNFNLPSRQFSALIPLIAVLAAAGATAPARLLARWRASSPLSTVSLGLAGAALVGALAVPGDVRTLHRNLDRIGTSHDTGSTLSHSVESALRLIDTRGARRHSVALLGAVDSSELIWLLGVPYNVVAYQVEASTRLIVEPSPATSSLLRGVKLDEETPPPPPRGWRLIAGGTWNLYAPGGHVPVRLG